MEAALKASLAEAPKQIPSSFLDTHRADPWARETALESRQAQLEAQTDSDLKALEPMFHNTQPASLLEEPDSDSFTETEGADPDETTNPVTGGGADPDADSVTPDDSTPDHDPSDDAASRPGPGIAPDGT